MTTSSGSITIADGTSTKIISQTKLWFAKAADVAPTAPTAHVTTDSATTYNAWNITKPNYNASYPYYFTCVEYKYKDNTYDWSVVELDVSDRIKKIWSDINGSYIASGINSATAVDINNTATWGFNSKLTPTSLAFNYNAGGTTSGNATFLDIGAANGLRIYDYQYNNGTYTGGTTRVQLTNTALNFFKPDGTNAASVSSAGLVLTSGGITAGTASSSGFVYLSTDNYGNYSINGSSGISDWKQIIGTKFGVRADGTLYASEAVVSGAITANSLTINAGANIIDNDNLINNSSVNENISTEASNTLEHFTTIESTLATVDTFKADGYIYIDNNSLILQGAIEIPEESEESTPITVGKMQLSAEGLKLMTNNEIVAQLIQDSNALSFLQVNNEIVSTLRMRSAAGVGELGWVAQSNGHLTLKVV